MSIAINALNASSVDDDTISRQAATEHLKKRLYETELNSTAEHPYYEEIADNRVDIWMNEVPSVQPERRPMLYRDRVMLAKNFEEWARENHVIDCPEAVICYLDIIGLIQPERKTGRWIPCEERLPEDGERVLATHLGGLNPDRQVIEHIYKNGEFALGWDMDINMDSPTFGQRYMGKVVAWMPLPEPYREGAQE